MVDFFKVLSKRSVHCFAKARSEPERNEDLNNVYVCVCV